MTIALLPSEIARLVLSYLEEEGFKKTSNQFLDECKHLEECRVYYKRGIAIPKTIHGKTLLDYLLFDPESNTKINASTHSQTDVLDWNKYLSQISSLNKPKDKPDEVIVLGNCNSKRTTSNSNSVAKPSDEGAGKKPRLLIGKNVAKVPELSCSTLERQLGTIISDASNYIKLREEQEIQFNSENYSAQVGDESVDNGLRSNLVKLVSASSPAKNGNINVSLTPTKLLMNTNNGFSLVGFSNFNQTSNNAAGLIPQQFLTQIPSFSGSPFKTTPALNNSISNPIKIAPNGKIAIERTNRPSEPLSYPTLKPKAIKPLVQVPGKVVVEMKSRSEMFKDMPARLELAKRGPKRKLEGPKNKRRIFNRVTPTIKQMMENSASPVAISTGSDGSNCPSILGTSSPGLVSSIEYPVSGLNGNTNTMEIDDEQSNEMLELLGLDKEIGEAHAIWLNDLEEEETIGNEKSSSKSTEVIAHRLRTRTVSQRKLT